MLDFNPIHKNLILILNQERKIKVNMKNMKEVLKSFY